MRFFRGVAHWRLGRNDLALADFQRVVALDDTNFTANQYADRIMSSQARWNEVIAMWTAFIQKNPASARAYFERGGTHFHYGDMAAALADATKACELQLAEACAQAARLRGR